MVVESEVIVSRLKKLENCLGKLQNLQKLGLDEYLENGFSQDVVERNLQIAIQCLLDIGNHLIAESGFRLPEDNDDILRVLAEEEVIPQDFFKQIKGIGGFRNILVHEYLTIDPVTVYQHLQKDLNDFREFASYITKFLNKGN